jgi:hypothetical protein
MTRKGRPGDLCITIGYTDGYIESSDLLAYWRPCSIIMMTSFVVIEEYDAQHVINRVKRPIIGHCWHVRCFGGGESCDVWIDTNAWKTVEFLL